MKPLGIASLSLLIAIFAAVSDAAPQDFVLVEDVVKEKSGKQDSSVALITLSESGSSEEEGEQSGSSSKEHNVSDDLIFLTHKKPEKDGSSSGSASASEEQDEKEQAASTALPASSPSPSPTVPPIDMRPFVALIPSRQVQAIASNYYRHDTEVQRAYAFLSSEYFAEMKQQIMQLPEVLAFTRYLNSSGLDVLHLAKDVWQASRPPPQQEQAKDSSSQEDSNDSTTAGSELLVKPLVELEENSTKEQLNGLHGLVDSVLDVLPQDQILATFFDRIEADQQFSRLIDSIGTPKFSKILSNLQNSVPLRNLIFELHNNRIYITRIVESLKSYFFLSSF